MKNTKKIPHVLPPRFSGGSGGGTCRPKLLADRTEAEVALDEAKDKARTLGYHLGRASMTCWKITCLMTWVAIGFYVAYRLGVAKHWGDL